MWQLPPRAPRRARGAAASHVEALPSPALPLPHPLPPLHPTCMLQIDAIWRLKHQLRKIVYKRPATTEELRERGEWLDGAQLVARIEVTKQETIDMLRVSGVCV